MFFGIGLVGSAGYIFPENKSSSDVSGGTQAIAMGLIVLSLLFNGILFVSEEKLFTKFHLHPF